MQGTEIDIDRRTVLGAATTALATAGLTGVATAESALDAVTNETFDTTHETIAFEGEVKDLGGAATVDVFFEWREQDASSWNATAVETIDGTGYIRHQVDGLALDTTYEYRLVA